MNLSELNAQRWAKCHVLASKGPAFKTVADRIVKNKSVYQEIEKETGVPWWFVGIVHYRESNLDMGTNIANGQRFDRRTTIVPVGRGPFSSFKEAAIDALVNCPPYAARNKDWSIGNTLTMFEKYNGLGYAEKNVPSPYVWAGTDQYVSGKYVADHVYDPHVVDSQLGCAGVLKFLGVFSGTATTAGAATAVVAGTGAAMAVTPSHHWPLILGCVAIALALAGVVYLIHEFSKPEPKPEATPEV